MRRKLRRYPPVRRPKVKPLARSPHTTNYELVVWYDRRTGLPLSLHDLGMEGNVVPHTFSGLMALRDF